MKRILILILFFAMLKSSVMPAVAFTDTAGLKCDEAVRVLSALGIVEGKEETVFDPEASLTRAEMATIILRTMDIGGLTKGTDIFTDVPSSHWGYANISVAYQLGIISGIDETNFSPDEPVKYAQAVKMIICALGYEVQAEAMGGYPAGYLAKAAQLGILKGVDSDFGSNISRGNIAIILYNALDVPLLEKVAYGPEASAYKKLDDVTLLSKYKKIYKNEGQVTANYYTAVKTPSRNILKGEIAIGSNIYNAGETDAEKLLGRKVKLYYNYPENAETPAILIAMPSSESDMLTIPADIINPDSTKISLVYDEKDSAKSLKADISKDAVLIYNGKVKADWTTGDLMPEAGVVTLISNDGLDADCIIVDSYVNYVVNTANTDNYKVYFKAAVNGVDSMIIDPSDSTVKLKFIDKSGEKAEIADLLEWDILSVAESEDGKVIKIVKSSDKISGKVTEGAADEVVINETSYTIASGLPNDNLKAPELAMDAEYHLDFIGNIAAVNTDYQAKYRYGYLVSAGYTKGLDSSAQFKIFNEDGNMILLDGAKTIKINGISYNNAFAIDKIPMRGIYTYNAGRYELSSEKLSQLIRYNINTDGTKLTELETAVNKTDNPDADDVVGDDGFNMVFELNDKKQILTLIDSTTKAASSSTINNYTAGTVAFFASRFLMRENSKIFVIPQENATDDKYSIKKVSTLSHGTDGEAYTNMQLYDIDKNYVVGAMVWDQGASGISSGGIDYPIYSSPIALITGISKGITDDDETATILKLYDWKGRETSLFASDDYECGYNMVNTDLNVDLHSSEFAGKKRNASAVTIKLSELKVGDVIQYAADFNNKPNSVSVLYRANTPGLYECNVNAALWQATTKDRNYFGGNLVSNGTVVNTSSKSIVTDVNLTDERGNRTNIVVRRAFPVSGQVIAFDMKKGSYNQISFGNILPGDKYLAIWSNTTQMMFIVYRNY